MFRFSLQCEGNFYDSWIFNNLIIYNQFRNILRLCDVLPIIPFTTSETMCYYYLKTWYIGVGSRAAERLKT